MRLFINSLGASTGGGLTYIRNVIPQFTRMPGVELIVLLRPELRGEFRNQAQVEFVECEASWVRRLWYEQVQLRRIVRDFRADVLLSTGNFALKSSPVPQILLSRNSIYTCADFYRDLLARREYRGWADTRWRAAMARKSIHWADITVAPTEAFAAALRRWSGSPDVVAIHHGFDREQFSSDGTPLSSEVRDKLNASEGSLKLLFVSHYNYYRNFETLIRALPLIREALNHRAFKLLLTCKLRGGENPGAYRPDAAAKLVRELEVGDIVVELGAIPYRQLHQIYRQADIYVTPAYTETFAHPLVESMSCAVPVVASDLAVHREICGDTALYFARFSPEELAARVLQLVSSDSLRATLSAKGVERASGFSWRKHVDDLFALAGSLAANRNQNSLSSRDRQAPPASSC